ncbi:hypothetical protein ACVWZW_001305 [Bradyrhizobium sp. F1.13.4]
MRLTIAMDATSASTVGTMIQPRLRANAALSACRSMSPDSTGAGLGAMGAGFASIRGSISARLAAAFATARSTTALSLPARQNAKRIEHSRRRNATTYLNRGDYTPLRLPLG